MFTGLPVVILILLLLFPQTSVSGAADGLNLWFHTVLPTLAPFMICTRLISSMGAIPVLMRPIAPVFRLIFGLSDSGSYILCCGLLCGYPLGASLCSDFLREGRITQREAQILLAICNHPSPMFLTGYLTSLMTIPVSAPLMLFCLYLPVLPISILARQIYRSHPDRNNCQNFTHADSATKLPALPFSTSMEEILMSTSETMVLIGNYIMLFSILSCWIRHLPYLSPRLCALCAGFAEITTGTRQICKVFSGREALFPTLTVTAFGGLSGIFQTRGVISPDTLPDPVHMKKNPAKQDSPPAAGRFSDIIPLRRSAIRRRLFISWDALSYEIKNTGSSDETSRTQNTGLSIRHYICWKILHALITSLCVITFT